MKYLYLVRQSSFRLLQYLCILILCCLLVGCDINISSNIIGNSNGTPATTVGTGANGLSVIVEPDDKVTPLVDAITGAQKSVWLEMYLLTNKSITNALEEDANRGLDVRVMLEPHPAGVGSSEPKEMIDKLNAAGVKAQFSDPDYTLTHEKGMIIDNTTAYIMTTNFSNAALGTGSGLLNREYDVVDKNQQDVQTIAAIFQADWNHSTASFNDPNLVVSPVNSRNDFATLIGSAKQTLLIEAEEMNDNAIEQDIVNAEKNGVRVEIILPAPSGSSDSNQDGIDTIKQGGVQVREDHHLYMHAKIIVVDSHEAFVGSENISTQSLDDNRELGILISDNSVLNTLQQTFQKDWRQSTSV